MQHLLSTTAYNKKKKALMTLPLLGITPVSYTHLDVYKRQQQYRDLLKKATNSMMSNIKNGIQLTTTGFSGTSTSTDKVHDEEVTIEEATSSSRKAEAEAEAAYDDKENEFDDEDTTTILSQPKRYNFKPVSYTHLDVYKRQAYKRVVIAVGVGKKESIGTDV